MAYLATLVTIAAGLAAFYCSVVAGQPASAAEVQGREFDGTWSITDKLSDGSLRTRRVRVEISGNFGVAASANRRYATNSVDVCLNTRVPLERIVYTPGAVEFMVNRGKAMPGCQDLKVVFRHTGGEYSGEIHVFDPTSKQEVEVVNIVPARVSP